MSKNNKELLELSQKGKIKEKALALSESISNWGSKIHRIVKLENGDTVKTIVPKNVHIGERSKNFLL